MYARGVEPWAQAKTRRPSEQWAMHLASMLPRAAHVMYAPANRIRPDSSDIDGD